MSDSKFANAGKQFRDQLARDFSTNDQAIARLREIAEHCRNSIKQFYDCERPDVYVDELSDHEIRIGYGSRRGKELGTVLIGSTAMIFVSPEGETLMGADVGWHTWDKTGGRMIPRPLPKQDWGDIIDDWLLQFLIESEESYRNAVY